MTNRFVLALTLALAGSVTAGIAWRSGPAQAQDQSPYSAAPSAEIRDVTDDSINEKARKARGGQEQAVRELADEILHTAYFAEMPDDIRQAVKQRVLRHEMDYRKGKKGVKEERIVHTVNGLADKFELPDYARTSPLQVRVLRAKLRVGYPDFIAQETDPQNKGLKKKVGSRLSGEMSPLEAVFTTAVLLQQKLLNEDFQVPPSEYADKLHKKELEKWQAAREGRQSEAGRHKNQLGFVEKGKYRELRETITRKAVGMSMADLLKLPDETLDALGIKR